MCAGGVGRCAYRPFQESYGKSRYHSRHLRGPHRARASITTPRHRNARRTALDPARQLHLLVPLPRRPARAILAPAAQHCVGAWCKGVPPRDWGAHYSKLPEWP